MRDKDVSKLVARLCDTTADVVYFPVRHHSPVCAFLVRQLIADMQPGAVLIEGPSDFNDHFSELLLGHDLPIAIYSYFRREDDESTNDQYEGVYYPFCEYSPEWVALSQATDVGAVARFVDLPWSEVADAERSTHRYADAELRRGRYVQALCHRLHVEDFDDLWDRIVESHVEIQLADYLSRVHSLCVNIRLWEEEVSEADRQREAYMASQIGAYQAEVDGRILVVTGGFHSGALVARLEGHECPGIDDPKPNKRQSRITDPGIALTTYSYERLDSLRGYDAGLPNPGFYEHAWRQRDGGSSFDHQPLLSNLVEALRERKQTLSTADLIAVETSARALAAIRGRQHVWRSDLIDAVTSSLIKDELEYDCESPFIDAVRAVLRGERQGKLAEGTRVPPLVLQIREQLEEHDLLPAYRSRTIELDLLDPLDQEKSRLLHRLEILQVGGVQRVAGTDFLARDDLEHLWESWKLRWSPEFESSCIEASRYGTSVSGAIAACLTEQAQKSKQNASASAALLVRAAQAGVDTLSPKLLDSLEKLITIEPQFHYTAEALGHLLFLYCYDEALGTTGLPRLTQIVTGAFSRSLWLLELLGQNAPNDGSLLKGMRAVLETFQRAGADLEITEEEFVEVLQRVQGDQNKPPHVRGGAAGSLWTIGKTDLDGVLSDLLYFANPQHLGDFLTGVFSLAREVAQRHPGVVRTIDELLLQFGADEFKSALPSLRLAFTSFTPREKHHMLSTLFESLGLREAEPLAPLVVDDSVAAAALAIEERLFEVIRTYALEESDAEA